MTDRHTYDTSCFCTVGVTDLEYHTLGIYPRALLLRNDRYSQIQTLTICYNLAGSFKDVNLQHVSGSFSSTQ